MVSGFRFAACLLFWFLWMISSSAVLPGSLLAHSQTDSPILYFLSNPHTPPRAAALFHATNQLLTLFFFYMAFNALLSFNWFLRLYCMCIFSSLSVNCLLSSVHTSDEREEKTPDRIKSDKSGKISVFFFHFKDLQTRQDTLLVLW